MAMPAPIAALPPVAASPLAVDDASACSEECSVSAPPLTMTTPAGMIARALAFAIVSATAAATLIGPVEVDALGVAVSPESSAPAPAALASAAARSLPTWLSTLEEPGAPSPGAPAALAVAEDDDVDGPIAVTLTAPTAVIARSIEAKAV